MPHCKSCGDPRRSEIDTAIVKGQPLRAISQAFGISTGSLCRHKNHIRTDLALAIQSQPGEREARAVSLLSRVESLIAEGQDICARAKADKKYAAASNALNSVARALELLGKLTGEIAAPTNAGGIHVTLNRVTNTTINNYGDRDPEWCALLYEATAGFNPAVCNELKTIAESSPRSLPVCNDLATPSVTASR